MSFDRRMTSFIIGALSVSRQRCVVQAPRPLPLPATLPAAAQAPGSSSVASFQSLTNTQVRHHKDSPSLASFCSYSVAADPSRA